jgi:hypothetical protein
MTIRCLVTGCTRVAPEIREICWRHLRQLHPRDRALVRAGPELGCAIAWRVMRDRMARALAEREGARP